jgi:hypothetical protein
MQAHSSYPRDQLVRNERRDPFRNELVLSVRAPSTHHFEPFIHLLDHSKDVRRIVLQVCIHRNDDVAPGCVEARCHRSCLSEVAPQPNQDNVLRVLLVQLAGNVIRAIGATIVHEKNFERVPRHPLEILGDFPVEEPQRLFFVEHGNHDRKKMRRSLGHVVSLLHPRGRSMAVE